MGVNDGEEARAWTHINIPQLEYTEFPVIGQISRNELCILGGGGRRYAGREQHYFILNEKTQEVTEIRPVHQITEKYRCRTES